MSSADSESSYKLAALYKFVNIEDVQHVYDLLHHHTSRLDITGGLIIASEGLNGTIAGSPTNLNEFINQLKTHHPDNLLSILFSDIEIKYSYTNEQPFFRMRIQIKNEIITMGKSIANPIMSRGIDIAPSDWNQIIQQPDVLLIDTRNDYEIKLGTFKNAINPNTVKFSEFPEYISKNIDAHNHPKIAMYCTGGIRCEKASSYLLSQGFNEVYQLKGGILKYLEEIDKSDSLFDGECYVFDHRTSVGHGLIPGTNTLCRSCRHPLFPSDLISDLYIEGIQCSYCYDQISEEKRRSAEERQLQMKLCKEKSVPHLGFKKKKGRCDGSSKLSSSGSS